MVSKNVFKTGRSVPAHDTVNKAGGKAYSLDSEKALCQYVVTNCFNSTYYSSSEDLLNEVKKIVDGVSSEMVAKAAVYGAANSMKDMPAYLCAVLVARREHELLKKVFNRVITNAKMLCNFVQIVRSGIVTGKKSFGTVAKKLVANWLTSRRPDQLFYDDIGKGNPSLADIIKMVHPKANSVEQNNMFKYVLGREFETRQLPEVVGSFEAFKKDSSGEVPSVPFQCLSNIKLTDEQWKTVALNMPWNTLRMNLNQIAKHNVFKDATVTRAISDKLSNQDLVKRFNAFPYQLLTTWNNITNVPVEVKNSLNQAMEYAVDNVPSFEGRVAVCVDVSGSMGCAITGNRAGATTKTSCVEVAGLIASAIIRKNKNALVVPFDTKVHNVHVNPFDSVLTNAKKLALNGGGTACSVALQHLLSKNEKCDVVIYVSDNMSWADYYGYGYVYGSGLATVWANYKAKNKQAKLVLIDLTPNTSVQVKPQKDVLNVGGFSDSVFEVIANFVRSGDTDEFVNTVKSVEL